MNCKHQFVTISETKIKRDNAAVRRIFGPAQTKSRERCVKCGFITTWYHG